MTSRSAIPILVLCALLAIPEAAPAGTADVLQRAEEGGRVAFLLVTEPGASGADSARKLIQSAMSRVKGSVTAELDRADRANEGLVAKFRLLGAPVPLILIFAPNGLLVGGLPAAQATPDILVKAIPSAKKLEVIKAIQEGKSVFITASRKGMAASQRMASSCELACGKMKGRSVLVPIDMDDKAEAEFLALLKIDAASKEPVTVVANAQGQITGSYTGAVKPDDLVLAAAKKVTGCCPANATAAAKSCAPSATGTAKSCPVPPKGNVP